jgi:hypothetical protein
VWAHNLLGPSVTGLVRPHPKLETGSVSETLCSALFLKHRTLDNIQEMVIPDTLHRSQKMIGAEYTKISMCPLSQKSRGLMSVDVICQFAGS